MLRDRRRAGRADHAAARPRHHAGALGDRLRRARRRRRAAALAGRCSLAGGVAGGRGRGRRPACSSPTRSTASWRSPTPTSTRAAPATTPSRPGSRSATAGSSGRGSSTARRPASGFVPEQHTDFIFTVAGEELGLVGAGVLIALLGVVHLARAGDLARTPTTCSAGSPRPASPAGSASRPSRTSGCAWGSCRSPAYRCRSCRTAAARCSPACWRSACCRTSTCAPPRPLPTRYARPVRQGHLVGR